MCCGKVATSGRRGSGTLAADGAPMIDPTKALFAAATPRYQVLPHAGATTGKTFSTQLAAEDYARRTGGIIRPI